MIECHHCKHDSDKMKVLEKRPLILIDGQFGDGFVEFLCPNKIIHKRRWGKDWYGATQYRWFEEECGNHILARKK